MPQYQYKCQTNHTHILTHSISECERVHLCPICKTPMHRIPQDFSVNWNGLPPHLADARPKEIQQFIDTAPERRAKYLETKGNK